MLCPLNPYWAVHAAVRLGDGADTADVSQSLGGFRDRNIGLSGDPGDDSLVAGVTSVTGTDNVRLHGEDGNDRLVSRVLYGYLTGGNGNDTLESSSAAATFVPGAGRRQGADKAPTRLAAAAGGEHTVGYGDGRLTHVEVKLGSQATLTLIGGGVEDGAGDRTAGIENVTGADYLNAHDGALDAAVNCGPVGPADPGDQALIDLEATTTGCERVFRA